MLGLFAGSVLGFTLGVTLVMESRAQKQKREIRELFIEKLKREAGK